MGPVVALNRRWILILSLVVTWVAASATPLAARAPALPAELAKVRAVLEKYQDPINAVRDGYLSVPPPCAPPWRFSTMTCMSGFLSRIPQEMPEDRLLLH